MFPAKSDLSTDCGCFVVASVRRWVVWMGLVALVGNAFGQGRLPVGAERSNTAVDERLVALGQRIYREGVGASGQPLQALGAAQSVLKGSSVACAACHRRSGYGTSEGQFAIRPITAPALFQEQTQVLRSPRIRAQIGTRLRPAYTEELLVRAIRSGQDAEGEPLSPVMPRYTLGDEDLRALSAYLGTLSSAPSPGVDEEDIHFATVIQPGVPEGQSKAMLEVMQAFFRDKAGGARSDERRRDAGTMRMYRSYRRWVLHVWTLSGPSNTWRAQLDGFYEQQPVFALVGGLGAESWQPVHTFCEELEIPSVFPQTNLPVAGGRNDYNFYFSRGISLEAEVLAKFMRDRGDVGRTVQVYRRDEAGLTAAKAFRAALPAAMALDDVVLDGSASESFWHSVAEKRPGTLVLWLGNGDLTTATLPSGGFDAPVYLSFDSLNGQLPTALERLGPTVRMVYPTDLPPRHAARLLRTKVWLHNKGIPVVDESVQINTQFALSVLSDAVGHIMDSFSRDYLAERIEHVATQTATPSIYQSVSLGPGQRFAAKGSSIVQFEAVDKTQLKALSGWIVP